MVLHRCKLCMFVEKEEVLQAVNNEYACSGTGDKQDTGCKGDNGGGELDQNMDWGPEYVERDLSRIWEETKSPGKAT